MSLLPRSYLDTKVYTREKAPAADEGWQHTRIVLKPLNPAHQPIVLTQVDEGEVRVIAEFVEVVDDGHP